MKLLNLLGLLFLVFGLAFSAEKETEDESVAILTTENFDKFLETNPVVLVEFYAPWCGYCKKLAPEYEAAAKMQVEKGGAPLAKVDATVETELATKYGVRGYPTIKLFRNGKAEEFNGPRDADGIVRWIESMTGPAVVILETEEEIDEAILNSIGFVGKFKSKDNKQFEVYEHIADANRAYGTFVAVLGDKNTNTISVIHPNEEPIMATAEDAEGLEAWLEEVRFPLFGPINADNYAAYTARMHEVAWFAGTNDHFKEAAPTMRQAAKKFSDNYSFVWLDSDKFGSHATDTLGVPQFPGLVIQGKNGRYVYPKATFDQTADLVQFATDVLGGKVEKSLKSEPIPETNDELVKVVVGKNFEELVLSKDKDVLLEVYAPWCGHCKKLEPVYKEFAEKVAHIPHLTVAKMDGAANESPLPEFTWAGFPTIFFVPAGKDAPVDFDGARTVDGLLAFVQEHASKPVTVDVSKEEL